MSQQNLILRKSTSSAQLLREAIDIVRDEFGPDAQVLRTREVARSGIFNRLIGRRDVEVTVASVEYEFEGEEQEEQASNARSSQSSRSSSNNARDFSSYSRPNDGDSVGLDLSEMSDDSHSYSNLSEQGYSDSYHETEDYRQSLERRLRQALTSLKSAPRSHAPQSFH